MRGIIVGLGQDQRADDAAGPLVARLVAPHLPRTWTTAEHEGDLAGLVELFKGMDEVVVVDAVRSGARVGTVHHIVLDEGPPCDVTTAGQNGSLGLLEAIQAARRLDRVPRRVTLVGLEARHTTPGAPMSVEVQVNLPVAAAIVLEDARASVD